MNKTDKRRLMRGLTALSASLLAFTFAGSAIAEANVGTIDEMLGTNSQTIETTNDGTLWTDYTSAYSTAKAFADANKDFSTKVEENGIVLLKNDRNALPLTAAAHKKLTLVGKAAYSNVLGGQMGSGAANNASAGYARVSLIDALTARNFEINGTMSAAYNNITYTTWSSNGPSASKTGAVAVSNLSGSFGMTSKENWIAKKWGYDINEVSQQQLSDALNGTAIADAFGDYKTSIVVLGRINSEGRDYLPGEEGVIKENGRNVGANDPLGLSDDERAMIRMAKDNSDRVVVLINSNSPMEIPEIVSGELEADAIVWIGTPGAYGMNAVAKVLDGTVNPSGHLPDTYAADISVSPAAQNWNIFDYANKTDIAGDTGYSADDLRASAYTVYQEGLYVGYKYYETRYFDSVVNPSSQASSEKGAKAGKTAWNYDDEVVFSFGSGISYTTFRQTLTSLSVNLGEKTVSATVKVENTGSVAGRDAVQLYASVPYTAYDKQKNIEKSAIQLLDYGKTPVIEPNKSATVELTADLTDLASYDNTAVNLIGEKGGYLLEAGEYFFTVGDNAHQAVNNVLKKMNKDVAGNAENVKTWTLNSDERNAFARSANGEVISNQLDDADLNYYKPNSVQYLSRQNWKETYPAPVNALEANAAMIKQLQNKTYTVKSGKVDTKWGVNKGDQALTLGAMKTVDFDDMRWQSFVEQINFEDAFYITAIGGNTTWTIEEIQNPAAKQADGPNGFSSIKVGNQTNAEGPFAVPEGDDLRNYSPATTPNAPIVAATFDKDLQRDVGVMYGESSLWTGGCSIWAGGANLHRAPYEGRTHEYFSEDPILSAYALLGMVSGARTKGCLVGPKHFAFNAIEYNRYGLSEFMTEQTAREGELRCFQKAFESGECLAVMTAFNRIGASYINGHVGLMQNILRGEWGFKGLATTDMVNGAPYFLPTETIMGGITMMANGSGAKDLTKMKAEWTNTEKPWALQDLEALAKDPDFNAQLQLNMKYQWYAYSHSNLTNGLNASSVVKQNMTWWRATFLGAEIGFGVLTVAAATGYVLFALRKNEQ